MQDSIVTGSNNIGVLVANGTASTQVTISRSLISSNNFGIYAEVTLAIIVSESSGRRTRGDGMMWCSDPFKTPTQFMLLSAQTLASEEVFAIEDGVGTTIRIDSGEIRITEDGSFIDHILCGGQQYTIDRPGRAIVIAQMKSRFLLYSGNFS